LLLQYTNAKELRDFIINITANTALKTSSKIILIGHSKGAVDATSAISLFPEIKQHIFGLVSLQGTLFNIELRNTNADTALCFAISPVWRRDASE